LNRLGKGVLYLHGAHQWTADMFRSFCAISRPRAKGVERSRFAPQARRLEPRALWVFYI